MMNKPIISSEDFLTMQTITKQVIECIFQKEESFKKRFIVGNWGWTREDYTLARVHLSGSVARVSVEFDDSSTTDIYLQLDKIYSWIIEERSVKEVSNDVN